MFNYIFNMFNNLCVKVATTPLPVGAPSPLATQVPVSAATAIPQATPISTPVQMPVNIPTNIPASIPVTTTTGASVHPMNVIQYIVLFIYFATCAALIFLVLTQTSKSEGLTGTLGGSTQTVFRGKKSFEEQIDKITTYVAVLFVVLSVVMAWFVFR